MYRHAFWNQYLYGFLLPTCRAGQSSSQISIAATHTWKSLISAKIVGIFSYVFSHTVHFRGWPCPLVLEPAPE